MSQGFDEMMALYRASVKTNPALMMEGLAVDSNRGVTSRGNSPYAKFAAPETRAKVLEARMQEIDAFAQSRSIPTAAIYAAAESAMRTGKIPDLGQFGMAGDDAVATKQFLISNVLNIQGLEWVDYKGDPVVEAELNAEMREQKKRLRAQQRDRQKTAGNFQMDDINTVADQIMSEGAQEGMRKATQVNTGEYGRPQGGRPGSSRLNKVDLKIGKTRSRRDGREQGEAGLADYRSQKESSSIDPARYMTEGSTSLRKLVQGGDITERPRGTTFGGHPPVARTEKGWQSIKRRNLRSRETEMDPPSREEIGDNLKMADYRRRTATTKTPEGLVPRHPESGSARSYLDKAKIDDDRARAERAAKKTLAQKLAARKATAGEESISIDPSRYMAEGSTKAGGYPFADKEKHYRGHSDAQLSFAHKDALEAAKAVGGHDPHAEGWYRDDAATIRKEMERRRKGVTSSVDVDVYRVVAEEGGPYRTGGAPESAPLSPTRLSDGGMVPTRPQSFERRDLLPKEIMSKLKQAIGEERVVNLTRKELFSIARERGLLGTEEGVAGADLQEHDYQAVAKKHGGKFVRYIPGNVGVYEFQTEDAASKFAGFYASQKTATPRIEGKRVFVKETTLGEDQDALTRTAIRLAGLSQEKTEAQDPDGLDAEIKKHSLPASESDKILGILPGDPRAETWPKISDEMRSLLNLEDHGVFRADRRVFMPEEPKPIEEATVAGGLGGFIGAGLGGGLAMRTTATPSYDASYVLPDDPEERVKVLKRMLDKHGLKDPNDKKDDKKDVKEEGIASEQKAPTVRDPAYDTHPSRFMK